MRSSMTRRLPSLLAVLMNTPRAVDCKAVLYVILDVLYWNSLLFTFTLDEIPSPSRSFSLSDYSSVSPFSFNLTHWHTRFASFPLYFNSCSVPLSSSLTLSGSSSLVFACLYSISWPSPVFLPSPEGQPVPVGQFLRQRVAGVSVQRVTLRRRTLRLPALHRSTPRSLRWHHCAGYISHTHTQYQSFL